MVNSRYNTQQDAASLYKELSRRLDALERRSVGSSQPVVLSTSAPFAAQAEPLGDNTKAEGVVWIDPNNNNAVSVFQEGQWVDATDPRINESLSDGVSPAGAPTVEAIGGIGAIHVRVSVPVVNNSLVTYNYYMSDTTGFTPDVTTLVASDPSPALTIKKELDGDDLAYGINYYIVVSATDVDGEGPFSAEQVTELVPAVNADISALYAYIGSIVVDQLVGGTLNADILLAAKFSNRPGGIGPGVDIDTQGINIFDALGTPATTLQPDLSKFKGDAEVSSLTATGLAAFRALVEIAQGSEVVLRESTTAPASPPSTVVGWPDPVVSNNLNGCYGLHWTGSEYLAAYDPPTGERIKLRFSGATPEIELSGTTNCHPWGGAVKIGSDYFCMLLHPIAGGYEWLIIKFNSSGTQLVNDDYTPLNGTFGNGGSLSNGLSPASLGTDGTNLLVCEFDDANDRYRIQVRNPSTLAVTSTINTSTNPGFQGPCTGILGGSFDFGSARYIILSKGGNHAWAFSSVGTYNGNEAFAMPVPGSMSGITWDGTRFWSTRAKYIASNAWIYKHTDNVWTGADPKTYYATSTWRDTNATGGLHETDMGPVQVFSMKKRAAVTLTSAVIPGGAGTDVADSVSFYLGDISAVRTNLFKQTDPAGGVNTATYGDNITLSGTNPPATNNFTNAAAAGVVKTGALDGLGNPMFKVDGAGTITRAANTGRILTQSLSAVCSANVDLGTSESDITGATITFNTDRPNAKVFITGSFYFAALATSGSVAQGKCSIDGSIQTEYAHFTGTGTTPDRTNSTQTWSATIASAGTHTIKLRGISGTAAVHRVNADHTTIRILVFE